MSPHPNSKKAKVRRARARAQRDESADLSKSERRLVRQVERRRELDRARRRRRIRNAAAASAVLGLIGVGAWFAFRPDPELAGVERPGNLGGGHVADASYDSDIPTSGAHAGQAPACGTYREPLDLPLAVHALEHGAVLLWYDAGKPELADELLVATDAWESHVVISAHAGLDEPIVATAWNRRKAYEPGDPEIAEFVDTYRRRGPEGVACDR